MIRNHPELVQILEIFIYSENTGIFLPVDILQKWFNFFIVKTTQTFHKGINFILKDPIIANYLPRRYIVDCSWPFGLLSFRYCILCKSQLSIGSGAKNDLTRHAKSQNHMQLEMVQRKSKSMSLFVATPNNSLKSKTTCQVILCTGSNR
jgi:hypothetical protein